MQTATGRQFWSLDPRTSEIFISDVAASLSKQCRFAGHCQYHYSVAQHSFYCSYLVPPELALEALLHDFTEAYCVDVPRPLKADLHGYAEIEQRIWDAGVPRFALARVLPQCVHDADNAMCLAEKEQIMGDCVVGGLIKPWELEGTPADILIEEWLPAEAELMFLMRFFELVGEYTQ
jgi:hypothetical protein